jgi:AbrB family looped-hinge helix DNA binding protein
MSELRYRVKVDDKGRLTIPAIIRTELEIKNGSILEIELFKGKFFVVKVLVK